MDKSPFTPPQRQPVVSQPDIGVRDVAGGLGGIIGLLTGGPAGALKGWNYGTSVGGMIEPYVKDDDPYAAAVRAREARGGF